MLDIISWSAAKNMAPLSSNTQTKKKNLAQFFNYSEGSKHCKTPTMIPNYHIKQYKAHEKNISLHMPFLCSTKRLIPNEMTPSWMQEFISCDATKYNQHQLEQDYSKQSKRNKQSKACPCTKNAPSICTAVPRHCRHSYAQKVKFPP